MNKKILLPIAGIALSGAAVGAQYSAPRQKIMMVENAISRFYVDTVNEDKLVEDAIRGMLEGLDPHSSYSDPEATKEMNEPLAGNFSGIGISYNRRQRHRDCRCEDEDARPSETSPRP